MNTTLVQILLGGSLISVLGGGLRYLIVWYRSSSADRVPLHIVTSTTTAVQTTLTMMESLNRSIREDNDRLRAAADAAMAREQHLRSEIERLEARVRALEAYVANLSTDIRTFRETEFPT